jgi:hypothetical protein
MLLVEVEIRWKVALQQIHVQPLDVVEVLSLVAPRHPARLPDSTRDSQPRWWSRRPDYVEGEELDVRESRRRYDAVSVFVIETDHVNEFEVEDVYELPSHAIGIEFNAHVETYLCEEFRRRQETRSVLAYRCLQ